MPIEFLEKYSDRSGDMISAMLDQSQDCVKLIALDGTLEYMNANGQAAMEIENFGKVAGAHWASLWPEESREKLSLAFSEAVKGRKDRFEGYCPTAAGRPRWWDVSVSPIRDLEGAITHVLATSRDITSQIAERKEERVKRENAERAQVQSDSIAKEMRHRMKNLLAVVGSLSRLMARDGGSAEDQSERMALKLEALGRAQDLVHRHNDRPIELETALKEIISAGGVRRSVHFGEIARLDLQDTAVQQLALILNELETNSLKHGALNEADGEVHLAARDGGDVVRLVWKERGASGVTAPERESAGMRLLRRLGAAEFEWQDSGVTVRLAVRR